MTSERELRLAVAREVLAKAYDADGMTGIGSKIRRCACVPQQRNIDRTLECMLDFAERVAGA